jgi:hypothetical protein
MPVILQNTTIAGIAAGGLDSGCVNAASIADGNVTAAKLANNSSSFASNGYVRMPNGFIIQWCESSGTGSETDVGFSFPIAFPNNCFRVVVGSRCDSGRRDGMMQLRSFNTSGGTLRMNQMNGASGNIWGNIVAIGN